MVYLEYMKNKNQCSKCGRKKDKNNLVKKSPLCKKCHSEYMKEWRNRNYERSKKISQEWKKNNIERVKKTNKEWQEKNKDRVNANRRSWISKPENREKINWMQRLKPYNLSLEEFNQLVDNQKNRCGICNEKFLDNSVIDHNHKTGKTRGLLCANCNHGLGKFKDSEWILNSAITYLKNHNHNS